MDVSEGATLERRGPAPPPPPSSDLIDHGRFLPGTLLGARYRMVELLGKGGMGEVYRADDLKLGQTVALKFLPKRLAADSTRLARLLNEVRVAREVSHPNVCRVYDVGDVEGEPFIAMEYVHGEDLADLLRRIGRLPPDKALQISRQVCAGLAAAHAKGVLHRDLKPGNVLLDERGVARITDFGLAGLAEEFRGANIREGTPAYMAPEQLAGKEVSVRSDIYSLGLMLYELFTGQSAFRSGTLPQIIEERRSSTPVSPSNLVDLDPLVERAILSCLEVQPSRRPASALAVAAALPGGNPLAEALAAGETPSPEMVAAAGESEGLRPGVALGGLAGVLAALALIVVFGRPATVLGYVPFEHSPETLADRAGEIVRHLGYTEPPTGHAHGFLIDTDYVRYVRDHDPSASRWNHLATLQPPVFVYWYRESPRYLSSTDYFSPGFAGGVVTFNDPPPLLSGMVSVQLDPRGHLVFLSVVPPQLDDSPEGSGEPDFDVLFAAAGLDRTQFRPTTPRWTPLGFAEIRRAWEGVYPDRPDVPLRVEAAAYRGKPVSFELLAPWARPWRMQPFALKPGERVVQAFLIGLLLAMLGGGVVVARRNLRLGRGDRRGAGRLALFVVSVVLSTWLLGADHVPAPGELGLFVIALGWAISLAVLLWLLYLAVEPYVRRRWPNTLISWSRVLAGSFRDPLVGRDLLVGALLGAVVQLLTVVGPNLLFRRLGLAPPEFVFTDLRMLMGVRYLLAEALSVVPHAMLVGLGMTFLLFILRAVFRRQWLAATVFVLAFSVPSVSVTEHLWTSVPVSMAAVAATVFVLVRFGLLAVVASTLVHNLLFASPLTPDVSAWYAGTSFSVVLMVLALAGFGFYASLGGRPLLREDLLEG